MRIAVSNGVIIQKLRMARPQFWTVLSGPALRGEMLKYALVCWTSPLGQVEGRKSIHRRDDGPLHESNPQK
jgi:hypothetical protein